MDEKKDFLTSENDEETAVNSDTDTVKTTNTFEDDLAEALAEIESPDEPESTGSFAEELADTADDAYAVDYSTPTTPVKKKSFVQVPIIISAIILVLVALGFLVFRCFFNTSIVGVWTSSETSTSTADEASEESETPKTYLVFEDDGTVYLAIGTMKMVGTYSVDTNDEGTRVVSCSIPNALEGDYEFTVSGNEFAGRKLTLTNSTYGQSWEYESTKREIPEVKVDDDFTPSDKLTGNWIYDDGYYMFSYDFKKDGTVTVNQSDILFVDGVYNYTDDVITIKYYTDSERTMEVQYQFSDDVLYMDGIPYTLEGAESTVDQAY